MTHWSSLGCYAYHAEPLESLDSVNCSEVWTPPAQVLYLLLNSNGVCLLITNNWYWRSIFYENIERTLSHGVRYFDGWRSGQHLVSFWPWWRREHYLRRVLEVSKATVEQCAVSLNFFKIGRTSLKIKRRFLWKSAENSITIDTDTLYFQDGADWGRFWGNGCCWQWRCRLERLEEVLLCQG